MGSLIKYPQIAVEITDDGGVFEADKPLNVQMMLNSRTNTLEVIIPVKEKKTAEEKPKPKTGGLYTGFHVKEIKVTECNNGEAKLNWQVKKEKTLDVGQEVAKNELLAAFEAIWEFISD